MTQKQIFGNYHPPTYEACNIILLNMKNHYRRLYTVKPAVDTSPPESYKLLSRKSTRSLSCLDLSLSNIPAYKFYQGSDKMKLESNRSHESQRNIKPIMNRHSCLNGDKTSNHHTHLKTRVKSTVSNRQTNPGAVLISSNTSKDFTLKEKTFDSGKAGSESSQDSAYNEGEVGSSERGSRTPTPETIVNNLSKRSPKVPLSSASYQRRANNYLYLKFLADVTDEILKKGVVTNKALKRIFQDHVEANSHHLNQNRMLLELEILREKLGMPENDSLNSVDFGLGSGNGSPNCLPLFRDENAFTEENCSKFNSKKPRSVLEKRLLSSKNSVGPDMLEAFTTLNDNTILIDGILSSIKSTSTNLEHISSLCGQFPLYTETDQWELSNFEHSSPKKTSKAPLSELPSDFLQKVPQEYQPSASCVFNQSSKPCSDLNNAIKNNDNKMHLTENIELKILEKISTTDPKSPDGSVVNHQLEALSSMRNFSLLSTTDNIALSEAILPVQILNNSQLSNDIDHLKRPPQDIRSDSPCENTGGNGVSLGEVTVDNTNGASKSQHLNLASNRSVSLSEDCLAGKLTDVCNLNEDCEQKCEISCPTDNRDYDCEIDSVKFNESSSSTFSFAQDTGATKSTDYNV